MKNIPILYRIVIAVAAVLALSVALSCAATEEPEQPLPAQQARAAAPAADPAPAPEVPAVEAVAQQLPALAAPARAADSRQPPCREGSEPSLRARLSGWPPTPGWKRPPWSTWPSPRRPERIGHTVMSTVFAQRRSTRARRSPRWCERAACRRWSSDSPCQRTSTSTRRPTRSACTEVMAASLPAARPADS